MTDYDKLKQLGEKTALPQSPDEAMLEAVDNPHIDVDYNIRFTCPEFTSLCPLTGQPDFAKFIIDYIPAEKILESKSLKLFMHSFRNHGDFHEACTIYIAKRIIAEIKPKWLRIAGLWYPRGGIPIDIFYQTAEAPKGALIPELVCDEYKGR
ncbi:MAG: NADPH-dependent 7-cyano-7-deazaguanine reductase QueF [Alphaproteobacteria bacterium CG11_big_fil_rev_8_21_14_0_20_44_7]|nr:MAG: NADPH-dependent 7-cyano-7-deazaguanine reductase QueF [Alphaproteobacteria bacterium CG11_big_fil_rev_8_21_14_0_20_44_7]